MKKLLLLLLLLVVSTGGALASEPIIEEGFKAFKEGGVEAAWKAWSKGGPLEDSKELMAQAAQFGQIGTYYGKYHSHEYVSTKKLGPKNKIVFVIINLEKGPLFGRFILFQNSAGKWTLPNFRFHTEVERVWPPEVFSN
ncbi:MAG: hypothetical protein AB1427_07975 [Thermodesulfobacteriota bacterium]